MLGHKGDPRYTTIKRKDLEKKRAGKPDWKDAEIGAELRYRCEHKGRHCVIRKYGDLGGNISQRGSISRTRLYPCPKLALVLAAT